MLSSSQLNKPYFLKLRSYSFSDLEKLRKDVALTQLETSEE